MERYLINQLHFITNTEMVLKYIRAGRVHDNPPPEFSLNAVKRMPDELFLPLDDAVVSLSASNADLPDMDERVKKAALSDGPFGDVGKLPESAIEEKIQAAGKDGSDSGGAGLIDRAVSNYRRFGFFSQYDWRLAHWGTVADVHSVTPATFEAPTSYLEFTTLWTPPLAVMQELANTFPSVRFKFKYRFGADDPWIVEDIFAFPPFGY